MKPPISILDRAFVYVPEKDSDIRKTFARIRREQKDIAKAAAEQAAREHRVVTLRRKP
jgi:hypothetical protein